MLTEERQQQILQLVQEKNIVKLQELTQKLDASESTIRRDLQDLEDQHLLLRIHGGAKKIQRFMLEPDMQQKTSEHPSEKRAIAAYGASLVHAEDVIYLDAGSTTLELIDHLPRGIQIKAVTNSVQHAARLIERQIETIILGGNIKLSTQATLGYTAIQQLEPFRFTKAFLGANGIELTAGITTPDPDEALLKKTAARQADMAIVLADASKFEQITFTKFAALRDVMIITDALDLQNAQAYHEETSITEVMK
ncbi:DeoR/GlpR family DNA-binding transcription regulator [Enterococcus diestrammenae]|uniref:DeoR/GlpR family DNA-binding transcription regulator n=1 Tax=Enterococcus diestrammenae TaxID=1155073 RepID=UPI001F97C3E4|nr:DeoR/GlpR family DNA-binding transcription regulator [Enterococcus diestrammenae]HIX71002.1 DeoR/GlpR family DNA-binding transcription regulator [Candidatus Enterococcus stercoravium]